MDRKYFPRQSLYETYFFELVSISIRQSKYLTNLILSSLLNRLLFLAKARHITHHVSNVPFVAFVSVKEFVTCMGSQEKRQTIWSVFFLCLAIALRTSDSPARLAISRGSVSAVQFYESSLLTKQKSGGAQRPSRRNQAKCFKTSTDIFIN